MKILSIEDEKRLLLKLSKKLDDLDSRVSDIETSLEDEEVVQEESARIMGMLKGE